MNEMSVNTRSVRLDLIDTVDQLCPAAAAATCHFFRLDPSFRGHRSRSSWKNTNNRLSI